MANDRAPEAEGEEMSAHEVGACLFLFCAGFLVGRFFELMVRREQAINEKLQRESEP
jgi:hypothetical protein